jgi:hypothetical protein
LWRSDHVASQAITASGTKDEYRDQDACEGRQAADDLRVSQRQVVVHHRAKLLQHGTELLNGKSFQRQYAQLKLRGLEYLFVPRRLSHDSSKTSSAGRSDDPEYRCRIAAESHQAGPSDGLAQDRLEVRHNPGGPGRSIEN